METKIEISYQLTDRELMEFAIKLYFNNLKNHVGLMCSSAAVLLLLAANVLLTRSLVSVFLIVMYHFFTFYIYFCNLKKAGVQKRMKMVLFHGVLEVAGDKNTVLPCSSYESVTVGRRLIFLRKKASAKIEFLTPIPVRAFASEDDKKHFIQAFRSLEPVSEEIKTEEMGDNWDYRFDCEIEKADILNIFSRLFQKERQARTGTIGWFGLGCFFAVMWSLGFVVFYMIGSVPIWVLFLIPVIWLVLLRARDKADGGMNLEKEYEKGRIRSDYAGHWEIRLGERGIMLFHAGTRSSVKWETYSELLESDILFCLYKDGGSEIVLIPKMVFKSVEEQNTFIQYCTGKGLRWSCLELAPVKPVLTRKRMIIAGLIFVICLPLFYLQKQVLTSFFSILQMGREEETAGALLFEPSDYPDSVYWFDFEGGDISCDYIDLLNGIKASGKKYRTPYDMVIL